ncbi:Cytochrome P450 4A7 [Galemys pyrenaicus]|uniref:Cytochrome P450 4A7 n=1 Tax=Galemys pyrenaicus TaxID=202257 RepID=A0A8J5ZUR9_GALPY|nr:Cytochrome P450 4A7 [Galemys pyrenaicus]
MALRSLGLSLSQPPVPQIPPESLAQTDVWPCIIENLLRALRHYTRLLGFLLGQPEGKLEDQDKWEQLSGQSPPVEIFGHVSLMTLDSVMKCAFSHQGSVQTDSGISWILYALASHPEHQRRCREELQSLLGDGAPLSWEHLDQMPYTSMCIKEVLRIYPLVQESAGSSASPSPSLMDAPYPRDLLTQRSYSHGGCHDVCAGAPPGIRLSPPGPQDSQYRSSFVGCTTVRRRGPSQRCDNHVVFDPSRFAPGSSRHSHVFPPLSGELWSCIGKQFAMSGMKVALTLLRFELVPVPVPIVRVVSENGIHLHLRKLL